MVVNWRQNRRRRRGAARRAQAGVLIAAVASAQSGPYGHGRVPRHWWEVIAVIGRDLEWKTIVVFCHGMHSSRRGDHFDEMDAAERMGAFVQAAKAPRAQIESN